MTNPKQEAFSLTSLDTVNITELDGVANIWSDIWKYQVPTGQGHVLMPSHTFSAYIEDGAAEVGNGTCELRISVRDTSEHDVRVIFGPVLYVAVRDFTDQDRLAKLSIPQPIRVLEKQWIVVEIKDDGTIDASDSYFEMVINRIRSGL